MQQPINESAWKRGWNDTKIIWTSWVFVILNVVCCGFIVAFVNRYWGIGLFIFAMLCVLVIKTALAPIKQRNEYRYQLLAKPIPLPNRASLIKAIGTLSHKTKDLTDKCDIYKSYASADLTISDTVIDNAYKAYDKYREALNGFENEKLIAGKAFEEPLILLFVWIDEQVTLLTADLRGIPIPIEEVRAFNILEFCDELDKRIKSTISKVDEISQ